MALDKTESEQFRRVLDAQRTQHGEIEKRLLAQREDLASQVKLLQERQGKLGAENIGLLKALEDAKTRKHREEVREDLRKTRERHEQHLLHRHYMRYIGELSENVLGRFKRKVRSLNSYIQMLTETLRAIEERTQTNEDPKLVLEGIAAAVHMALGSKPSQQPEPATSSTPAAPPFTLSLDDVVLAIEDAYGAPCSKDLRDLLQHVVSPKEPPPFDPLPEAAQDALPAEPAAEPV